MKPMQRDKAIDVLWAAMMVAVPVSADNPVTDADRQAGMALIGACVLALESLGVSVDEMKAAQDRYAVNVRAGNAS